MNWKPKHDYSKIVLAIHGYNDYANAFKIPGSYLSKHGINLISFDLKGFGRNADRGEWYDMTVHLEDIIFNVKKIKKENPGKSIFLLGESMGGAILLSLINKKRELPISGVILVAPAIWNFSESNFFKSIPLKILSKLLPHMKTNGKGLIKVQASNNFKLLNELSKDKFFIHKPTFESLQGIVDLMDESFVDTKEYVTKPSYKTFFLIPMKDEIVPRKPIIKILKNNDNIPNNILVKAYQDSYHMMLRDKQGNNITEDIKNWINNENFIKNQSTHKDTLKTFENSKFYHRLD